MIVNSTSSNLDLSKNASAKALSAAAGSELQQECKAIGQVQTGGIVVTSGGNLKCKHVFHTSCAGWENGKGEQVPKHTHISTTEVSMYHIFSFLVMKIYIIFYFTSSDHD